MIDSHCHLGIDDYKDDISGALARAKEAGVEHILTVACHYNQLQDLLEMMKQEGVYGAFGIHPECALDFDRNKLEDIFETHQDIIALGEIGLDYYYNLETKNTQLKVFQAQLEVAHHFQKPVIIHTREADADTITLLKENASLLKAGGVLHCFSGSTELAQTAVELGFYISASGIITFPKAQELRDIFKTIPLERLLIETDAPYLAPVPYRGKQNEPAYVAKTLAQLADLKGVSVAEMEEITNQNFQKLFLKEKGK